MLECFSPHSELWVLLCSLRHMLTVILLYTSTAHTPLQSSARAASTQESEFGVSTATDVTTRLKQPRPYMIAVFNKYMSKCVC